VGDIHYVTLLMRRRSTVLTVHDVEFLDRAASLMRLSTSGCGCGFRSRARPW
jgi:hypothetical protein